MLEALAEVPFFRGLEKLCRAAVKRSHRFSDAGERFTIALKAAAALERHGFEADRYFLTARRTMREAELKPSAKAIWQKRYDAAIRAADPSNVGGISEAALTIKINHCGQSRLAWKDISFDAGRFTGFSFRTRGLRRHIAHL